MSKQPPTVPCPDCQGKGGKDSETTKQATDSTGNTVTVYSSAWNSCGTCIGSGQIAGGR